MSSFGGKCLKYKNKYLKSNDALYGYKRDDLLSSFRVGEKVYSKNQYTVYGKITSIDLDDDGFGYQIFTIVSDNGEKYQIIDPTRNEPVQAKPVEVKPVKMNPIYVASPIDIRKRVYSVKKEQLGLSGFVISEEDYDYGYGDAGTEYRVKNDNGEIFIIDSYYITNMNPQDAKPVEVKPQLDISERVYSIHKDNFGLTGFIYIINDDQYGNVDYVIECDNGNAFRSEPQYLTNIKPYYKKPCHGKYYHRKP